MLLSLDGTLVVQLVNFLIFLVVLNAIFLRPVGAAIAKRRAYINGVVGEIEQYTRDVKQLRVQADERRAHARREADGIIAAARAHGQSEAERISADFAARAGELTARAHQQVEVELVRARADEERIVAALADDLVARAIGTAA